MDEQKRGANDGDKPDSVTMEVPHPDYDGIVSYLENDYSGDRISMVRANREGKTGGTLTIQSGEYPAFNRFVKDMRPKLHENGFVISNIKKEHFVGLDGEGESVHRHVINAIPIMWVLLYVNGYVCYRGACRHITDGVYCEDCSSFFDEDEVTGEARMVNP